MLEILAPDADLDEVKSLPRKIRDADLLVIVEYDDDGTAWCIGWAPTRPEADAIVKAFG